MNQPLHIAWMIEVAREQNTLAFKRLPRVPLVAINEALESTTKMAVLPMKKPNPDGSGKDQQADRRDSRTRRVARDSEFPRQPLPCKLDRRRICGLLFHWRPGD